MTPSRESEIARIARRDRPGLIALASALHLATHQCDGNCGEPMLRGDGLETRLYDAGLRAAAPLDPEGPRAALDEAGKALRLAVTMLERANVLSVSIRPVEDAMRRAEALAAAPSANTGGLDVPDHGDDPLPPHFRRRPLAEKGEPG
jgi:hypothetical protein